jgi:hypothetical protein
MPRKNGLIIVVGIVLSFLLSIGLCAGSDYKISLKRIKPSEPISRDGILSAVNDKYDGRIMSVQEKPSPNAPDCHIVRMLGLTGEYMTIYVACGE